MIDEESNVSGIVVGAIANYLLVEINTSCLKSRLNNKENTRFLCTKRNRLLYHGKQVYVGDHVTLEALNPDKNTAVVSALSPRKSFLNRPPIANITQVFVVLSILEPTFDFDQANRFLITAEKTCVKVNLILTKRDLISDDDLLEKEMRLREWGYRTHSISLFTGEGLDSLLDELKKVELAVLCGPSGVGKSSLLNHFMPEICLPVAAVSRKLKRGRHTTRNVQLYSLRSGSYIADTPGFNRPDLDVLPKDLALLFPEIRSRLIDRKCKFRDCLHRDEPGCVVGKDWERYTKYRALLQEIIHSDRQVQGA